jgi:hypothetical protein
MIWLLEHTRKFPKDERFRLQQQIDQAIFTFHDSLVRATQSSNTHQHLKEADIQLIKLRTYLRVAVEMGHTSHKQFQYASRQTTELGKLLGAWIKRHNQGLSLICGGTGERTRVLRGGGWNNNTNNLRSANRNNNTPDNTNNNNGFRCARFYPASLMPGCQ